MGGGRVKFFVNLIKNNFHFGDQCLTILTNFELYSPKITKIHKILHPFVLKDAMIVKICKKLSTIFTLKRKTLISRFKAATPNYYIKHSIVCGKNSKNLQ